MVALAKQWILAPFCVLLLLVMASVPVLAAYSTVFSPVDNEILPNETATFELAISNFGTVKQRFQVYSIDPSWLVKASPLPVSVAPGSTESFTVSLKPKTDVPYGSQGISVNVKDLETNDVVKKTLIVAVKRTDALSGVYAPSIAFDFEMPTAVDPREPIEMHILLRNRNSLSMDALTMVLDSPHFAKEVELPLGPLEEKRFSYRFNLDPLELPGDYTLKGRLVYRGESVSETSKDYSIMEYSAVHEQYDKRKILFRTAKIVELSNDGNIPTTADASLKSNFFARIFTATEPDAEYVKTDAGSVFIWHVALEPHGTATVTLVENYNWLALIIILIAVALALFFLYRSPVVSLKEVVGITHGEGVSDIKIRIFIKNRSNKIIQGVEVLDKVPSIAELTKTHVLGTIKPTKVTRLKSGTVVRWNLDILEPYEERILTYSIRSKLKIVGRLSLPQTKIKFETGKGKERVIYSNNILFVEKKQ